MKVKFVVYDASILYHNGAFLTYLAAPGQIGRSHCRGNGQCWNQWWMLWRLLHLQVCRFYWHVRYLLLVKRKFITRPCELTDFLFLIPSKLRRSQLSCLNTSHQITSKSLFHCSHHTSFYVGKGLDESEVEWAGKSEMRMAGFLVVGEACMTMFSPTPGSKERTGDWSGLREEGAIISASTVSRRGVTALDKTKHIQNKTLTGKLLGYVLISSLCLINILAQFLFCFVFFLCTGVSMATVKPVT